VPDNLVPPPVVEARGLVKSYPGVETLHILRGLDLAVRPGEFVAVTGQSGSGKSTLLNLLAALDRPSSGEVLIDGRQLSAMSDGEMAEVRGTRIGLVFQFHHLLEEYTCLENALLPVMVRKGAATRADVQRVRALLETVGLGDRLRHRPSQLSGGQQQRTAIVRAFANEPRVILADEPTGNLDSRTGAEVFRLFREMNRRTGVAILLVTHDDRLARQTDRVIRIADGLAHEEAADESLFREFRGYRKREPGAPKG
jgi:lipoprotein-releasing system ATP-binding protein